MQGPGREGQGRLRILGSNHGPVAGAMPTGAQSSVAIGREQRRGVPQTEPEKSRWEGALEGAPEWRRRRGWSGGEAAAAGPGLSLAGLAPRSSQPVGT